MSDALKAVMGGVEIRQRISSAMLGKSTMWLTGRKQSPLTIEKRAAQLRGRVRPTDIVTKINESNRGRKRTEETKQRISEVQCRVWWLATSPSGESFRFKNLNQFCKDHGLNVGNMCQVAKGKLKHYKGWIAQKLEDE